MKNWMVILCLVPMVLSAAQTIETEGVLEYEFGDGINGEYITRYHLLTEHGKLSLDFSQTFLDQQPIQAWLGKRVSVSSPSALKANGKNKINALRLLEGRMGNGVTGSQPWVSLLCKFNDIANEPKDLNFFNGMYANQAAGLDHYWREVSYDHIDVVGSVAVDWVDLPSPRSTYVTINGDGEEDADLNLLFDDCTAAADALIDFSDAGAGEPFVGINMMFNDNLDCCAWGGGRFDELDGVAKVWRTTWNPPWSFQNEGVIAHEMGHGFGLPHANNSDGDGNPYDSPWDVMSSATGYAVNHPTYGLLGKHINMYFKRQLGWVSDADGWITNSSSYGNTIIDNSAMEVTSNDRYAYIPLSNGTHYVVEVRKRVGTYEVNIPGEAVIIHHVDVNRSEPPWVVDADDPAADYSDNEGVMWKVGEVFVDPIDGIEVEVMSVTTDGFEIQIRAFEDLIFDDGFDG